MLKSNLQINRKFGGKYMQSYSTSQRKLLMNFFKCHIDEQFSAKQIAQFLSGRKISLSAVYRNLSTLEKDGLIKRFTKPNSRDAFFQYTANEHCADCLHLSCKKCGKTYHMKSESQKNIINSLEESDGFTLDKTETVIYGLCKECSK